jgi:hypothetical protein
LQLPIEFYGLTCRQLGVLLSAQSGAVEISYLADLAEIVAMEPVTEPAVAEMSRPVIARTALSLFGPRRVKPQLCRGELRVNKPRVSELWVTRSRIAMRNLK